MSSMPKRLFEIAGYSIMISRMVNDEFDTIPNKAKGYCYAKKTSYIFGGCFLPRNPAR